MSTQDLLANIARSWNRKPTGVALGTERTGVSAALWTHDDENTQEVWGEPDPTNHILPLNFATVRGYFELDGTRTGRSVTFGAGTVHLIQAGQRPRAIFTGRLRCLHFYIPGVLLQNLLSAEDHPRPTELELIDPSFTRDPVLERVGMEVLGEMSDAQPLSRLQVDALGQKLAIHLLRHYSNLARFRTLTRGSSKGGLASWQERRTTEYLTENLAADVSLDTLAGVAGLSTFHFARAFKRSTGLPPHAYQRRLRLERAKALLAETDLPVTEIALTVGYDSSQALARLFQREVGVSPSHYRREKRS